MTGLAMANWRRLDHNGTDRCTLSRLDHGWMLSGQAKWLEKEIETSLIYAVRCDEDWSTLSADVVGSRAGESIAIRIQRHASGWFLNDKPQRALDFARDIDLSFTPATNLLPLRRLSIDSPAPINVSAAWLVPELDELKPLDQSYARTGPEHFAYSSPGFTAELKVHDSGFVLSYPGLWEGWVDA